jgi:hypothetical protein
MQLADYVKNMCTKKITLFCVDTNLCIVPRHKSKPLCHEDIWASEGIAPQH